ncbi:MAG: hypothetical protein VW547_16695 [Alphaproteobacteria bacterium]|jgi:hypothetical protein
MSRNSLSLGAFMPWRAPKRKSLQQPAKCPGIATNISRSTAERIARFGRLSSALHAPVAALAFAVVAVIVWLVA